MCVLRARVYTAPESRDSIVASSSWCSSIRSANLHNTTTARKLGSHSLPLNISLHPNISIQILHTILYIFPKVLTRRICVTINSFFSWWSFPLFSWPSSVIQGWYCKEKLHASHSQGTRQSHNVMRKSVSKLQKIEWFAACTIT